jgi:glyoxylate/hydroxypyruvate reductase A
MTVLVEIDAPAAERAEWMRQLQAALPAETLVDALAQPYETATVDAALVGRLRPGVLAALPNLRFVQSLWAGVERLLVPGEVPPDIPIARLVDPAMTAAMAETVHWAVLGCHRGFFCYARQQREAQWRERPFRRADEITVLVLGLGELGRAAAQRLAAAGYVVQGWSRRPQALPGVATACGAGALPGLFNGADVVINLLPLTPATQGLFDRERLAWLRPAACLVNLARGAHVVDADLLAALDAGRLRHAVLDVFNTEPLPDAHPYWQHPRVTVLPHVAAPTDARSAAPVAAANLQAWRAGRTPAHRVDRTNGY